MTKWKIQHEFVYGWDDFELEDPDVAGSPPVLYATEAEADKVLTELLSDLQYAYRCGHMKTQYSRAEFKVVEVDC